MRNEPAVGHKRARAQVSFQVGYPDLQESTSEMEILELQNQIASRVAQLPQTR